MMLWVNLGMTELIEAMGCAVRPCLTVADAVYKVQEDSPDVAILDVKIGSTTSYVLADWLRQRGVPIIFVTAYETVTPPALGDVPVCRKPCGEDRLRPLLANALKHPLS
jgi:CheY-like chemotaxis protein